MSILTSTDSHLPIPRTLTELLSTSWLSAALGTRFPGIRITDVTPGPAVTRVTTNALFRVECEGGPPPGLFPSLCGKGYFSAAGQPARHVGVFEVSFYRDLAERTGVRTLRGVYADVDPTSGHNVLLTEDVVAQGGVFLDATTEYTPDLAAQSLTELAQLHSATWGDPVLAGTGWLAPRLETLVAVRGLPEVKFNFDTEIGSGVPTEVRDAERLVAAYRSLVRQVDDASPWSVIHGDAHVGNLYLDGLGRPCFADWQLVQRGPWYLDVGYHLGSALAVEDRRRAEDDLLRHYLGELRARGVEPPSWDDARLGLRRGVLHGFYLWGITQKVDPAVTSVLLHRLGTAAADHDAFAAV